MADLDHEAGKARDAAGSALIVSGLAEALGTPPTVLVTSGQGVHAYWALRDAGQAA